VVFTFIVLAGKILQLTEWMVNHGIDLTQVALITLFTLPYVLFFTLPMATLLSSVAAFSRFNEDSEIIALKSSGLSIYQLFPPVVLFSFISYVVASFIAIYFLPVSNYSMARLLFEVAQSNTSIGIRQGVFNDAIPQIVLYANQISAYDQTMEGVFIFDERDPTMSNTIIARQGRINPDPKRMSLTLNLLNGSSYMVTKDLDSSRTLRFQSYDLRIELEDIVKRFSSRMKAGDEMSLSELMRQLKEKKEGTARHNILAIELHRKFSIPFACLLLGVIGLPLGLMIKARARAWGIALSIGIFVAYYILLSAGDSLGETGTIDPALAMWIPNMVLGFATLVLIRWVARDG
jgi:lipopolysaccharide export system permease protein